MSEKTQPENNAPEEIKDEILAEVDGGYGELSMRCPKCNKAFIGFECPACGTSVRY